MSGTGQHSTYSWTFDLGAKCCNDKRVSRSVMHAMHAHSQLRTCNFTHIIRPELGGLNNEYLYPFLKESC